MDQTLPDRQTADIDASEYSDTEEVIDVLLAAAQVLDTVLNRKQPKHLEQELRSVLNRVLEQVKIEEQWLH